MIYICIRQATDHFRYSVADIKLHMFNMKLTFNVRVTVKIMSVQTIDWFRQETQPLDST